MKVSQALRGLLACGSAQRSPERCNGGSARILAAGTVNASPKVVEAASVQLHRLLVDVDQALSANQQSGLPRPRQRVMQANWRSVYAATAVRMSQLAACPAVRAAWEPSLLGLKTRPLGFQCHGQEARSASACLQSTRRPALSERHNLGQVGALYGRNTPAILMHADQGGQVQGARCGSPCAGRTRLLRLVLA